MKDVVKDLIEKIEAYLASRIDDDDLEQATMEVIVNDNFDTLDESIQDLIYTLDSKELNNLSRDQIKEIRDALKGQLK
jgi:hypothetical protein